jgi:hypothetical protein
MKKERKRGTDKWPLLGLGLGILRVVSGLVLVGIVGQHPREENWPTYKIIQNFGTFFYIYTGIIHIPYAKQ